MRSDTRLQFIVDSVPALIAYVDSEERYRFNNYAYEQWFGRPRSEVYGRTVREVLGEEAYMAAAPHVRAALAGRLVTFEESLVYPDGNARHVKATYAPDAAESRAPIRPQRSKHCRTPDACRSGNRRLTCSHTGKRASPPPAHSSSSAASTESMVRCSWSVTRPGSAGTSPPWCASTTDRGARSGTGSCSS